MTPRRPFVAGNWKMFTRRADALALAMDVSESLAAEAAPVDVAVCPPFVYLDPVGRALQASDSPVALGAQDVYTCPEGAFTGEVCGEMLRDVGCSYVLTGHSERRHILGESDELVGLKTRAAIGAGLHCIVCVGETIDQRQAGQATAVSQRQVESALSGVSGAELGSVTIAYEPVWAIGTGVTATPADAQNAHRALRALITRLYSPSEAARIRILYGGSVKPSNAAELFAQPDIDGGLIGGASLKASDFLAIVRAASPSN